MKALFVKYDELPWGEIIKGIYGKPIIVDKLGASIIKWDKGVEFPPHEHNDEQINFFLKGKMEWTVTDDSGERTEIVTEGTAIGMEPHVLHSGRALEDSEAVEIYYPSNRHLVRAKKFGIIMKETK